MVLNTKITSQLLRQFQTACIINEYIISMDTIMMVSVTSELYHLLAIIIHSLENLIKTKNKSKFIT